MTASEGKKSTFIGVPEGAKRDRGPESVFEQIIAENLPNLGKETGIQIQERGPSLKSIKTSTLQHLIMKLANSKERRRS